MKKTIALLFFFLLMGSAFAAPSDYVGNSGNFCSYICMGKGGATTACDPTMFNCDVYIGVIWQETMMPAQLIPCDAMEYIAAIFPTLLGGCGIIIPSKDIFIESIKLSSQQVIVTSGTQTVTVTVRNTNDIKVDNVDLKISVTGLSTPSPWECNYPGQALEMNGVAGSSKTYDCTFRPAGGANNPTGQNIDATFATIGTYKATAELSGIDPLSADKSRLNNFAESFFSVIKERSNPIPEIALMALPIIAVIILYAVSRRPKANNKHHKK